MSSQNDPVSSPTDLPLIGQIAKLQLRPEDILVLSCKTRLSALDNDRIRTEVEHVSQLVGFRIPCMVLDEGLDLKVLSVEEIRAKLTEAEGRVQP